jgi:hypothetical protein
MEPFLVAGITAGLAHLILNQAEDQARVLNADFVRTGRPGSGTTLKIKNSIDKILAEHRYAKIGKTVRPAKRLQATDYRNYHTMYLVYETTSDDYICHYESYFINKYRDQLDNKHENSTGRVADVKGKNYLYVVVAG